MSHLHAFTRAARLLATALLLTLLAVSTAPRPAAAHQITQLHLVSLKCIETEDWLGADNPYLRVNGQKVWSGRLNDGQTANLTHLSPIPFRVYSLGGSDALIELYEDDEPDPDDRLGRVTIDGDEIGPGIHTINFFEDGANYNLTYYATGQ
jgi:hypothetical protein